VEVGIFFRGQNLAQNHAKAAPEAIGGGEDKADEEQLLKKGKVQRLSEVGREMTITQTNLTIQDGVGCVRGAEPSACSG